ncbi:MAG: N-acetylmuramoyl-L-alanine amidase [Treponema sp.]|nr:N-acetylmuramoyl-L-alanine amidase [Treponema sp.]
MLQTLSNIRHFCFHLVHRLFLQSPSHQRCLYKYFLSFLFICVLFVRPVFSLDLLTESSKTGTMVYYDPLSGSGILEKNGHQISFRAGDNIALLDNRRLVLIEPVTLNDGKLEISNQFLQQSEKFFQTETDGASFKIGAVIVDPGHGGKDPGAMGIYTVNGKKITVREKDVTLAVGKMLYSHLKAGYPDKKIYLTRSTDTFLSLSERTEIANSIELKDNEAAIYISIHANASLDKKASGYEVWYLRPDYRRTVLSSDKSQDNSLFTVLNSMMEEEFTTESILIAKFVMDGLQAQLAGKSVARGIKADEWFVVRNAKMPSVLSEIGFVTNEKEALLLNDTAYLKKIANGIYNGLGAFIVHFERSRGFTKTNE